MFVSATQKRLTWIGDPLTLYNHDLVFIYLFIYLLTYLLIAENQHLDDDDDDVPYLAGKEVFIAQTGLEHGFAFSFIVFVVVGVWAVRLLFDWSLLE
jgi:hypothetical protein